MSHFKPCSIDNVKELTEEYIKALSSPIDSFLENHILNSAFYQMYDGSTLIGYFAIHSNEKLTQFYIAQPYLHLAQDTFKHVLEHYSIRSLFVPTCDELFLSMALDLDFKIEKEAYFFQDSKRPLLPETLYPGGTFHPAGPEDVHRIIEVSGDFLQQADKMAEKGELFTFTKDDVLLGIGVLERSKLLSGYASIGMFTNKAYRQQGVGQTVIHHLKQWCYEHNTIPICGCWYYNTNSKKTLERAGMVSKTRLLNLVAE
ncbi:GNAT family N-acetyltransferase [Fictibacillus fluitans]|uniref:GNAT family N-acetyltransferase n=1 Tax=Fictibacillus fluitans TaxID=3058422 RepID=A0ABT8HWK6_9BACL|nr:GNAT family N-acetyltransferase [Fictibacillus sp. NE201]MDN4525164.1 GNAT family N-acetyltransferase [Fictibacillus sp. NE201]